MKVESKHFKRRFVIPDIHGCKKTLKKLVKKIELTTQDAIFFLGDYIDRGPNSSGVIDYIIELKEKKYNVFTIRGNHENDFLEASRVYDPVFFYKFADRRLKSSDLLTSEGIIIPRYRDFFEQTVYFIELEDFILVHAGFNFKRADIYSDRKAMLYQRDWEFDISRTNGRRIIHGHQPAYFKDIANALDKNLNRIPLDNGCVYNKKHRFFDYTQLGKLCCLELNSLELICQKNKQKY